MEIFNTFYMGCEDKSIFRKNITFNEGMKIINAIPRGKDIFVFRISLTSSSCEHGKGKYILSIVYRKCENKKC